MNAQRSIAVYRHLSALYPKSFRAEYGTDLIAAFTQQLSDDGVARTWLSTSRDLVVTVPSQHLEARMKRPDPHTVAMAATTVTVAALVLAVVAGTGPVVGVFLLIGLVSLVVATLGWKAARPAGGPGVSLVNRWRTLLFVGVALVTAAIVVVNVSPYNDRELPGAGWALLMLSLITGVGLITVGLTMGLSRRSARHTSTN